MDSDAVQTDLAGRAQALEWKITNLETPSSSSAATELTGPKVQVLEGCANVAPVAKSVRDRT